MVDVPLRRVLRSDELPMPASASAGSASLRERATAGTIVHPHFCEVDLDGDKVLLTRLVSGEVVAFAAYCPHQGAPLRNGNIDRGHIRCEQHKYLYDPRTGRNVLPSRDASPKALERLRPGYLTTYDVDERDGWVWIGERPKPPPRDDAPPQLPAMQPQPAPPCDEPLALPPQTVEVVAGQEFELDLPTRHRPSHVWRLDVSGESVEVLGQRLDERADGLHYVVRAMARSAGTAEIDCVYGKPWGSPHDTRTFLVHVRDA